MLADDLAGLIQSLDLDSPYIFGCSDGGQAALDLGIRYPDIPGALVLAGVWFQFSQYYQDGISAAGFVSPGKMDYQVYEKFAPRDWMDRLSKAHRDPSKDYPRILLSALAKLWWTALDYSDEDFQKIQAPVLILAGENDEFIPIEEAPLLAAKIPQAELAIVPEADHELMIPQGIDLVVRFLSRLDS
jgi:pimeloyl-ACP methyl ester carboxylesterase